jgi:two-component system, response regulator YesN
MMMSRMIPIGNLSVNHPDMSSGTGVMTGVEWKQRMLKTGCPDNRSPKVRTSVPGHRMNRKIVLGFLLSYLIVLVLPTVTGSILYVMAARNMQAQTDRANLVRLRDTESVASQQLGTMITFMDRMAMNRDITSLGTMATRRKNSTDILRIKESAEAVRLYSNTNPLIAEYYIHYNRSDVTLSSTDAFLDFSRFYGTYFKWNNMDAEQWSAFASKQRHDKDFYPAAEVLVKSGPTVKTGQSMIYLQSLPLEYHSRIDGYLAVVVDQDELQRLLSGVELGDAGQAIVLNTERKVLTGVFAAGTPEGLTESLPELPNTAEGHLMFRYGGNQYSITFVRSVSFGWTYLSAVPTSFAYGQMWQLGLVVAMGFLLALLGGAALAFWLSRRNARPWQEIAAAIGLSDRKESLWLPSESDRIRRNIMQMVENNRDLAQVLETQRPIIQAIFLFRLLSGKFLNRQQLDRDMHLAKIGLQASGYLVVILGLDRESVDSETSFNRKTLLRFLFQEKYRLRYSLFAQASDDMMEDGITLLLPLPAMDRQAFLDDFKEVLHDWHGEFRENHHLFLKTTVGQVHDALMDVHLSFDEARQTLPYAGYGEPFWYADLPKGQKPYFFPIEFENQILHQVWAGNREVVEGLFERLSEENLVRQKLSPMLSGLLASEICGTLIHLLERTSCDVPALLQNIQEMAGRDLPDVMECARVICLSMADKAHESQQQKEEELHDAIIDYVKQMHANPCLCIADLRAKFPISVNAINALFVEKTGKTFSNFLEAYRMDLACEYFKKGRVSVQEVSDSVGYTSAHSFRRAFKRRYNILPTEYQTLRP